MQVWKWTPDKERVLLLVFEGRLSQAKIGKTCGIPTRTIESWVTHEQFKARLEQMRADMAELVASVGYAQKEKRVLALAAMAESAREEYEARPWLQEVRPTKDGNVTNEHFNEAAFAQFRGALDDIAKELGQRKQVAEVTGKDGGPIEIAAVRERIAGRIAGYAARAGTLRVLDQPESTGTEGT